MNKEFGKQSAALKCPCEETYTHIVTCIESLLCGSLAKVETYHDSNIFTHPQELVPHYLLFKMKKLKHKSLSRGHRFSNLVGGSENVVGV